MVEYRETHKKLANFNDPDLDRQFKELTSGKPTFAGIFADNGKPNPSNALKGMIGFNTSTLNIEICDGTRWIVYGNTDTKKEGTVTPPTPPTPPAPAPSAEGFVHVRSGSIDTGVILQSFLDSSDQNFNLTVTFDTPFPTGLIYSGVVAVQSLRVDLRGASDGSNVLTTHGRVVSVSNTQIILNFIWHGDQSLFRQMITEATWIAFASSGTSGMSLPFVEKSAAYTLSTSDYMVNCTANTFTVTLPTAVGMIGKLYEVKNTGTGLITVTTTSGQTIDGSTTQELNQYDAILVQSNGANWVVV